MILFNDDDGNNTHTLLDPLDQVVHDGLNCKQYQDRMNNDSDSNEEARRTSEMLNEMIDKGEAMKCPVCQVSFAPKSCKFHAI